MISSEQEILGNVFDNTTTVFEHNRDNYFLLIKRQKSKDYCTLFLTDCTDNFWIQKINIEFCQRLKTQIKLKSDIKSFAQHFVKGIKDSSRIQEMIPRPVIKIRMKVSQGLIINANLCLEFCISQGEKPEDFKKLLKNFFKQLYEAKDAQAMKIQTKNKEEEKQLKQIEREDKQYIKSILGQEKKPAPPPPKNRDLINPNRKKRKNQGMKVGTDI